MNRLAIVILAALPAGALPIAAQADIISLGGRDVLRTMVTGDGTFGGCMVQIDYNIAAVAPNCNAGYVSMSCTGDFNAKDAAWRMFDSAQMAYALGKRIRFIIDDQQLHNGLCVAKRAEVID